MIQLQSLLWLIFFLITVQSDKDGLDILIMGDFGGSDTIPYTTEEEVSSAAYMGLIGSQYSVDMVWSMGDNIYNEGAVNEYDPRFNETFESVFIQKSLLNIPFYIVAGNHDYYGNISAEIFYSNHSDRWIFPNYYYTKSWNIPNSKKTLQLIMIDTIMACGTTYDSLQDCNAMNIPKDKCYIEQPQFDTNDKDKYNEQLSLSMDQWEWIENELNSSTADYLIVAGHFPIWNVGKHQNTDCLVEQLRPLLIEYNVTMYVNGHSHTMEYIAENDFPNLGYVTSGATHGCDNEVYNNTIPPEWVKFHGCKDGGFNRLHINDTAAFIEYYYGNSTKIQFVSNLVPPRVM